MKFRFGCRGCPACNMNHKHQQSNFKRVIFFSRGKEKKNTPSLNLLESDDPPPTSTSTPTPSPFPFSEQRLGSFSPEYCMKFQATSRARMEAEWAAGDGLRLSRYLRIGTLPAHIRTRGAWEEWLATATDLYFPSLLSILWDQLGHGNTGGGLLQRAAAAVGLYVHRRLVLLLDQDLHSHTPLLSKSLRGAQTFTYLWNWVLLSAP